jgi:hypothetical protein
MLTNTQKVLALAIMIIAGCTFHAQVRVESGDPAHPAPPPDSGQLQPGDQARRCATRADCGEHESCVGEQGCDAVWTCQPERTCTMDLVPFCGCNGETFRASSTCPSQAYVRRGSCDERPDDTTRPITPAPVDRVRPPQHPVQPLPQDPETPRPVDEVARPDVPATPGERACTSSAGCRQGEMCLGEAGCDARWTCQPSRPCTLDLVPFCGCDNQTFRGSSTCPGRPYAHRGACAAGTTDERPSDGPPVPMPSPREQ